MRTGRPTPGSAVLGLAVALLCAAVVPSPPGAPRDGWPVRIEPVAAQVTTGTDGQDQGGDEPTETPGPVESPTSAGSPEPEPPSAPAGEPSPITRPRSGSPVPSGGARQTGAAVHASNAVLTSRYWSGERGASLTVTVINTGNVTETIALRNAPPAGVRTASCPAGCAPHVPAGKSRTLVIGLLVDPDAWQSAPLGGRLDFTATAPGAATRSGHVAWGVVFPPGPLAPGLTLRASDVHLDLAGGQPVARGQLTVQVTNSGKAPGAGEITVLAPAGVTFGTLPAACLPQGPSAIGCATGVLAVGKSWEVLLTLLIPPGLGTDTSLVGLVRAKLSPYGQSALLTQASYQILATPGQAGTSAEPASTGAAPHRAAGSAPVLPIIGGSVALLIVVAIGLALTLSRRREADVAQRPVRHTTAPSRPAGWGMAGAGTVSESTAGEESDATAMLSAGPVDRTPTPRGPVQWEWIEDEQPDQPRPAEAGPTAEAGLPTTEAGLPTAEAGPAAGNGHTHGD